MRLMALIRSVFASFVFVFHTILLSSLGFVVNLVFNDKTKDDRIIGWWAQFVCFIFNVKVVVKNPENIPASGCVVLFNHSSFFDIFALAAARPDLRFGAKLELFSIPFFGPAMRRAGTLPIARNNREETFRVYSEAKGRFVIGQKFALSPEGGRFYGENLSPFKTGPFLFAMSSEVELCPVIIHNAYETLPKGAIFANSDRWSRTITLEVLPPVETKGYQLNQRQELVAKVYQVMNQAWINPRFKNLV
jgi:1-acyl-sn-glycerol-3-phosphate acyltransferase